MRLDKLNNSQKNLLMDEVTNKLDEGMFVDEISLDLNKPVDLIIEIEKIIRKNQNKSVKIYALGC